jgi:ribosomal protein S18 acetylase RimI-like enzyme
LNILVKKASQHNQKDLKILVESLEKTETEINQHFFSDNKNICFIAYIDGNPVGYIYGYILTDIKKRPVKIFLYSIDVLSAYQRKGVATKLINYLKAEAIANKCSEVFVLTNSSNLAAMKTYKATGGVRENEDDVMFVYELK